MSLHLTVVLLGCLKEALDLREEAEDIHFAHSFVETLVAVLIIIIRIVSAWYAFKQIKKHRHKVEHVDVAAGVKTRSRVLKHLLKAYTVNGIFFVLFAIACFLLFFFLAHLGWTILSNNFALVVVMALDGLLRERMGAEYTLVKEDHQKAVLFETTLLLDEMMTAPEGPVRQRVSQRVVKFQKALKDTDAFKQPSYIYIPDDYKPKSPYDTITTMEVVSQI